MCKGNTRSEKGAKYKLGPVCACLVLLSVTTTFDLKIDIPWQMKSLGREEGNLSVFQNMVYSEG